MSIFDPDKFNLMQYIEMMVDTALQKHGCWRPELVADIDRVMTVAKELAAPSAQVWNTVDDITTLADIEKRAIYLALIICNGDHLMVAKKLGIYRSQLEAKLLKYKHEGPVK